MIIYKKLIIRTLTLLTLIITINYIYKYFFYEIDLRKHSKIINLVRNIPYNADIIYIGESSNITSKGEDTDKRSISAFTADYYPNLKVYDITKPASHAGVFKVLLRIIPEENKASTVIVTLNLRSFNAQWIYSDLETSLQKSIVLLRDNPPLVNRLLLSFKAYDIKTEFERKEQVKKKWRNDAFHFPFPFMHKNVIQWDRWMAEKGVKDKNGMIDIDNTQLACHYIKTYAFQIDTTSNPRIEDFDEIITLSEKRGWKLVFNLLAENTEMAKQLVGNELIYLIKENTRILKNYFNARGVIVVDNLNAVKNEHFIDQKWTTEHYSEEGRKKIAENVAKAIKQFYPNEFKQVVYSDSISTSFYNNCDNKVIWGQMQTISDKKSFSGTRASLTGRGNDYSITFEYPLKKLPDSCKNNIHINFMYYHEKNNQRASLVIEAKGNEFQTFWKGYKLQNSPSQSKEWHSYKNTIPIPNSIKNADLIKIFVFNPSNDVVYIDDFKIEFE